MTNRALLVIDMQEHYMSKYDREALINKINERSRQAETDGDLIVFVKNNGKLHGERKCYELANGMYVPKSFTFVKDYPSAFTNQDLKQFLKEQNIEAITMVGIDGSCCVAYTAMDAIAEGYIVNISLKCIGSRNQKIFEKQIEKMRDAGVLIER